MFVVLIFVVSIAVGWLLGAAGGWYFIAHGKDGAPFNWRFVVPGLYLSHLERTDHDGYMVALYGKGR